MAVRSAFQPRWFGAVFTGTTHLVDSPERAIDPLFDPGDSQGEKRPGHTVGPDRFPLPPQGETRSEVVGTRRVSAYVLTGI
jgi:hypothetical protein